jgi:hypothetical protein
VPEAHFAPTDKPSAQVSCPCSLPISVPTVEDLFEKHSVPDGLRNMDELQKMGVVYAFEARGIVEEELNLAVRRFHQQAIVLRTYELRVRLAQEKLSKVNNNLEVVVDVAGGDFSKAGLDKVSPATAPPGS